MQLSETRSRRSRRTQLLERCSAHSSFDAMKRSGRRGYKRSLVCKSGWRKSFKVYRTRAERIQSAGAKRIMLACQIQHHTSKILRRLVHPDDVTAPRPTEIAYEIEHACVRTRMHCQAEFFLGLVACARALPPRVFRFQSYAIASVASLQHVIGRRFVRRARNGDSRPPRCCLLEAGHAQ